MRMFTKREPKFPILSAARFLVAVIALLVFAGCANPHARTGRKFYNEGFEAEEAGNYALARLNFYQAYVNAEQGKLGPALEAHCLYEWSRNTGYLGMTVAALRGFDETLTLIEQAKGEADSLRTPTLCELARLLHDTGQHRTAIMVYQKALAQLDQSPMAKDDPIAFADFLDDYATSLRSAGETASAEELAGRAAVLRQANKGLSAKFVPKRYKESK